MSFNPFTILPDTLCDAFDIPALAQCQDTTTYLQLRSQVGGLLILPVGATPPDDWELQSDWASVVDNSATDNSKAKYLVGRGSFLPNGIVDINLAGGRLIENRERFYRLTFVVLNMNDGHTGFGKKLQKNIRNFDVWILTIGDRMIGGEKGLRPYYVNADFVFNEGNDDREQMIVTMDFVFEQFPAMTSMLPDFNGTPIAPPDGGDCNCDIQELLNDLGTYDSDASAAADGVLVGQAYIAAAGHDRSPMGDLTTRLS